MSLATLQRTSYNRYGQKVTNNAGTVYQMDTPQMASYSAADTTSATSDVLDAFTQNLSKISATTSEASKVATTQALDVLEQTIPGYKNLMLSLSNNAQEDLNNRYTMPADMQDQIKKLAAENGISRGTAGGFNKMSLVKDFGINLIDYSNAVTNRANATLQQMQSLAPTGTVMSPFAFMGSADTQAQLQLQQKNLQTSALQSYYNTVANVSNFNSRTTQDQIASEQPGFTDSHYRYQNYKYSVTNG